ncbi:MAG TPA: CheR family methyltransferase [Clostridia bacterium]|nr:CheR family methyltransferase [Clostridia bacterium]
MPRKLIEYVTYAFGKPDKVISVLSSKIDKALKKIYILLRAKSGNDFSQYKTSTICRRVERRMGIHQIEYIDDYVKYLQQFPAEAEALFRDLLIGVTCFFRDPEAFEVLEQQGIPKLFDNKQAGDVIRVWIPCCSTGEEAYSIAILLKEYMDRLGHVYTVQIFATDIDSYAITTARAGVYPASIALDISSDRLKHFFTVEPGGETYRILKCIRDMLIFSEQNVIKDPPFSKLDLISCRNFLIYLGKDLQKKVIDLFQYALNPDGLLFLGNSENVGESNNAFIALDHKSRLFQNEKDYNGVHRTNNGLFSPFLAATVSTARWPSGRENHPVKMPMREIAERALLQQQTLVGILVDRHGDIYYLHGRAGMYLELAPGEVEINNILKMAREGLRRELATALHKTVEKKEIVRYSGLRVKMNGSFNFVNLSVHPVETTHNEIYEAPLYLVILEQTSQSEMAMIVQPSMNGEQSLTDDIRIEELKQQLWAKEEYLQAAVEELEVQTKEGRWYLMRIQPYRTLENVIEGAVITFGDISEIKRMERCSGYIWLPLFDRIPMAYGYAVLH